MNFVGKVICARNVKLIEKAKENGVDILTDTASESREKALKVFMILDSKKQENKKSKSLIKKKLLQK